MLTRNDIMKYFRDPSEQWIDDLSDDDKMELAFCMLAGSEYLTVGLERLLEEYNTPSERDFMFIGDVQTPEQIGN